MWRNRHRTIIAMSAIFFAVVLSVVTNSLQDGVFDNLIKNVVSFYSGYVQVHKQGYWDERILDNTFVDSDSLVQRIRQDENITAVAPRLESFALASSAELTKGCMVIGISPLREDEITHLSGKLVEGQYLDENDKGILLGQGLARRLNLQVLDTLVLLGQGYHGASAAGKYAIRGFVKFGSPDLNDQSLFISLREAQLLYSADNLVTSYVLALENPVSMDATASKARLAIGPEFEVLTWEQMMPEIVQHIETDTASNYIIQAILYFLVGLGILGTILMMMAERKYEMGMLVAIGMKKFKLMQMMIIESVATVLCGCAFGLGASIPLVYYLKIYPIRFTGGMGKIYEEYGFEPILPASTDPGIFLSQGIVVLIVGLVLSLYPLVRIAHLDPVNAMRR